MWREMLLLAVSWWWMVPVWVGTFLAGVLIVRWLILRIPADYFVRSPEDRSVVGASRGWRALLWGLKNGSGLLLAIAGLVMIVTPGPGLLAIVLGLSLIDFPGKRGLEERLLCHPRVLHAANRVRERNGMRPLISPRELVPG
jgi:hypothetical protein